VSENLRVIKNTVSVDIHFEEGAEEIVSDPDKIQQIFTNLMGNAFKYSPDGTQLKILGKMRRNVSIISVIDQGPGIPPQTREKIFEPFYRIHDDVGKKVRGTGLGLSIARAIVEAMGGVIRVEGEIGKGSNFTFALPKELPSENGNGNH
jgi:signal transduction histidine kinase